MSYQNISRKYDLALPGPGKRTKMCFLCFFF